MRVSDRMRFNLAKDRVEDTKTMNADALKRLSTQKKINELSDDPTGVAQVFRFRQRIANLQQYQQNIEYAKGFLERSESALKGISNNLIRAKELAVGMSNDTYDAASRRSTAREVKEIIDEVVQLGNSSFNGRYIFGGFRNQTPPLSRNGAYSGDDGAIHLQVGPDSFRQVNKQARYLFEPTPKEEKQGHFGLLESLKTLYRGLENNDKSAIHKATEELSFQLDKTSTAQASIGGMWNALDDAYERLDKEELNAKESLSGIEDTDVYKATSDFKRTKSALQSTLLASTKLLQPSLLNFLK